MANTGVGKSTGRALENALKSSMDVQSLNNLVSSLRIPVKKSKVDAIHRLTAQIGKIRKKKGTEEQLQANNRKADRLVEEIAVIKKLNLDKVAKFALGNTYTLEQVASVFKGDMEMKAMVRLSSQKPMQNKITKWRQQHGDWRALAAYIVQHTGRRYKPKEASLSKDTETKPKFKHQLKSTELAEASKLRRGSDSRPDDNDSSYHSDNSERDQSSANEDQSSTDSKSENRSRLNVLQSENVSQENKHKETGRDKEGNSDAEQSKHFHKIDKSGDRKVEKRTTDGTKSVTSGRSSLEAKHEKNPITGSEIKHKLKESGETERVTAKAGEMVVKKLNLDELVDDDDISFVFKGTPAEEENAERKKRKKAKNDFFITGDDSDGSVTSGGETGGGEESDEEWEDEVGEGLVGEARRAMYESTFLGSLAGPAPKYKDYAALRRERKGLKQEESKSKFQAKGKGVKGFAAHTGEAKGWAKSGGTKLPKGRQQNTGGGGALVEEKLHPSWEASKKRKMQQATLPSFQGKKKTFDE